MKAEPNIELTSDQLDEVSGGMSDNLTSTIFNILAGVPALGAFTQCGRAIGNAIRASDGKPPI